MPMGRHPPHLVLGRRNFARLLYRLAAVDTREARDLYVRLAGSWGRVPGRVLITVKPTPAERAILKMVSSVQQTNHKESISNMATKSKVSKSKVKPVEDDIDELEAELEGLEEVIEEEEEDAPEVEEEDEEEGGEYDSLTSAQLKALCKERRIIGITGKTKVALVAMLEAADEEPDDEDEEEDDEDEAEDEGIDFEAMDRSELKAYIKEQDADATFKKSQSDDDLREIAAALEGDDDEDEDDDEEEDDEPVKAKAKKGGPKKGVQPEGLKTRVLPKGKLGANDIAEQMGTSALNVRNFLRSEAGQKWPKDGELGRYAFSTKQVAEIVKAMKSRPPRQATVSGEEFKARMAAGRAKKAAATTKPAAVKGKKKRTK